MRCSILCLLALGCSPPATPRDAAPPPPKPTPGDAAAATPAPDSGGSLSSLDSYFEERERLDKTVWAAEVLAQRYEGTFIDLWDRLRDADDPGSLLAKTPVGEVLIPALSKAEALGDGVTLRRGTGEPKTLDQAGWHAFVHGLKKAGWKLVQSEWHHRAFEPEPADARKSTFSMELHLQHQSGRRAVVRALLKIDWQPEPRGMHYRPQRVVVDSLRVLERAGALPFERVLKISMGDDAPKPVLAHDLNGDGLSEILLPWSNLLYVNLGKGKFTPKPLTGKKLHLVVAAVVADVTGDGHLDLVVHGRKAARDPLAVWMLRGHGGTKAFGPKPELLFEPEEEMRTVRTFAVGDYDGDGDLDLFFGQYRGAYNRGQMPVPFDDADNSALSYLLRNEGGGRFVDVTEAAGITTYRRRYVHSASFVDLDADGDLDLLTANDYAGIDLWVNAGGTFSLENERLSARYGFGMSHAVADFDADGRLDVFVTGMNSTTVKRLNGMGLKRPDQPDHVARRTRMTFGNHLLYGSDDGKLTAAVGNPDVQAAGWAWGSTMLDWNNDGRQDLFVANGFMSRKTAKDYCTRYWSQDVYFDNTMERGTADLVLSMLVDEFESGVSWNGFEHNRLFTQGEGGRFHEAGWLFGLGAELDARNAVADDIDGDGRMDLLVSEAKDRHLELRVMRNVTRSKGRWIGVRLRGPNPWGARVTAHTEAGPRVGVVVTGDSYVSQHAARVHFGLGAVGKVDRVEVRWPDGRTSTLPAPKVGRYHDVSPPAG